ncbi:MAG TPA: hypothetical protein P5277_00020 [Candidatus Paceibacterota bacterium]|nr:hypothetical protein [Candidatus Paceibacterota bacterium]
MRLYRKGKTVDSGSSWFPTIAEAMQFEKHGKESNLISVMIISKENFDSNFEANGIGYRAKTSVDYGKSNPVIETMSINEFERRLNHPVLSRLYWDGQYPI